MSIPLSQLINPRKAKTAKPAKKLKNKIIRTARTDRDVENAALKPPARHVTRFFIWVTLLPQQPAQKNGLHSEKHGNGSSS